MIKNHLSRQSLKLWGLIATIGVILSSTIPTLAQSDSAFYWRYDAPGPLSHVEPIDLNHDNLIEFLIATEDNQVIIVEADGRPIWKSPYTIDEPIALVTSFSSSDPENVNDNIVVATDSHLILLDDQGHEKWIRPLSAAPIIIKEHRRALSPTPDLLVALTNGSLIQFNGAGQIVNDYHFSDPPASIASPILAVADLDRDLTEEVVYSYLSDAGFSKLIVMDQDGLPLWERSNSGGVTSLEIIEFDEQGPLEIAVATSLDRIYLFTHDGERRWPFRSPNKEVTSMISANLNGETALMVGTSVGNVLAYDRQGRKIWSMPLDPEASRKVLNLSTDSIPGKNGQTSTIAVLLEAQSGLSSPADVILLDETGQRLEPFYPESDLSGLSKLIDVNSDGRAELLLAGFSTLELLNPGIGAREYFEDWDYRLGSEPKAVLVEDIDLDGSQEILVGTADGKLHALRNDGSTFWIRDAGGIITNIEIAKIGSDQLPMIIIGHNSLEADSQDDASPPTGQVDVLRPDGRPLNQIKLSAPVSSIQVGDINRSAPPELLVGTTSGELSAYSLKGDLFWQTILNASISRIALIESARNTEILATTAANTIFRLNNKGATVGQVIGFYEGITGFALIIRGDELIPQIIVGLSDESLRSFSTKGNQLWEIPLNGNATTIVPGENSIFITTDEDDLLSVNLDGRIMWRTNGTGRLTSLYQGDLDGDVKPDIAVGSRDGEIRILTADGESTWDQLNVASEVFFVSALGGLPTIPAVLVAVTDNGILKTFTSQSNLPPLLTNPKIETEPGNYNIAVAVRDIENDPVSVSLQIFDENVNSWKNVGQKIALGGNDTLFWSLDPPKDLQAVRYRFLYDDGTHRGIVEPAAGPPPAANSSLVTNFVIGFVIVGVFGFGTYMYIRQRRSPATRVRRLYQKVRQQPELTLDLLELEYYGTGGSPNFLLNLANTSRQELDEILAQLSDGLYLLTSQPESAMPIIIASLEEAKRIVPKWRHIDEWLDTYRTGQALLVAPSLTELNLLRTQLELLIIQRTKNDFRSEAIEMLPPILGVIRDSERIDRADDRLIYLDEALGLLKQVQHQSRFWPVQIENVLVEALIERWFGLVRAEIEELKGRAQLSAQLITERIAPDSETIIALNIKNSGRSPAEHIFIELQDSPAFEILSQPQTIPVLVSGRERQVRFPIKPNVDDSFRVVFRIYYNDIHGDDRSVDFADRVSFLTRERTYEPIVNPYSPGMPLRKTSAVFYGRDDLFNFVARNIGSRNQRNVLILVGQRRTGKTSALLRLDQRLPEDIYPIYIDCQSLGVTPGMPALFHDLAWNIADALASRGYQIDVPNSEWWQIDPTGRFEREFLPSVRRLLPKEVTVLLVFDEFEAFENFVYDGILPATLFTYFRHLMQHGKGLGFIFSGTHRLEEMSSDYWSVLFNAGLYKHISYLSESDAKHLIRDPVTPFIIYDDLAVDKILRVTAGHPYFLQLVCYTLVNRANNQRKGYITISDVNATLDEMLKLGEVHFAYLWQRSSYAERAILTTTSRLHDYETPFRPAELVQMLAHYNIQLEPTSIISALNRLVEREILKELPGEGAPLYSIRVGLVAQWVAQNKSVVQLYDAKGVPELTEVS